MFNEAPSDAQLMELMEIMKELDPLFREYLATQIKQLAALHRKSKEGKGAGP